MLSGVELLPLRLKVPGMCSPLKSPEVGASHLEERAGLHWGPAVSAARDPEIGCLSQVLLLFLNGGTGD